MVYPQSAFVMTKTCVAITDRYAKVGYALQTNSTAPALTRDIIEDVEDAKVHQMYLKDSYSKEN